MAGDKSVRVHHLTRVEGHGDLTAEVRDGRLEDVRFTVVEAPRFFEAILRGRPYDEVTHIASRICGICAVSHKCAALKAVEAAFGTEIGEQTLLLRRLAFHGEIVISHILHLYFLAAPDFLGLPSVLPLIEKDRDLVLRAMRLKKLGYDLAALVAGRHTHPVAMTVGGFGFLQSPEDLSAMRERLAASLEDLEATVQLFGTLKFPDFHRETVYVSLRHPLHYAFYDGEVVSSLGDAIPADRYAEAIEEATVPPSTAKYASWRGRPYMVGALARVNNNHEQLGPRAREAAGELGLSVPCFNPFMITAAQLVECVHCVEESIELIERLLDRTLRDHERQGDVRVGSGRGVGAVEAPRGILFHEYELDHKGRCRTANHVIPTAQNLANLDADLRAYAPGIVEESEESFRQGLEMLVRAYDPCISCSTHVARAKSPYPD